MSGIEFTPLFYALPLAVAMFSKKDRYTQTTLLGLKLGPSRSLQQQEQQDHTTRRSIFQQWAEVDQQPGKRPMRVNHDDEISLEPSTEVTIDDEASLESEPSMEVTIDGMPVEIAEENAAFEKGLYSARQMEKRWESRVPRSKTADPTKRQVVARQA
jgi:hypothetical protein